MDHTCNTPNYTDGPCEACAKERRVIERNDPSQLPLLEWVRERYENCLRLAKLKEGADQDSWLEDAHYFRQLMTIVRCFKRLNATGKASDILVPAEVAVIGNTFLAAKLVDDILETPNPRARAEFIKMFERSLDKYCTNDHMCAVCCRPCEVDQLTRSPRVLTASDIERIGKKAAEDKAVVRGGHQRY